MKHILAVGLFVLSAVTALGQGTVNFINRITGTVDAPVFDTDGVTRLAGSRYLAQLYGGPTEDTITAVGDPLPFRTGVAAGYIDNSSGTTRLIPGVPAGGRAFVQVRAWDAEKGSTFEAAAKAGAACGTSPLFSVTTGGGLIPPMPLRGLTSFHLAVRSSPVITTQPASITLAMGSTARFEVTAIGSEPLAYQWKKGGVSIPGATQRVLEIGGVVESDAALYTVRVSNDVGFIDSSAAELRLLPLPVITGIFVEPTNPRLGQPLKLTVSATAVGPMSYQWLRDGIALPGATSSDHESDHAEAGLYSVRVTSTGGTVSRDVVQVANEFQLQWAVSTGGRVEVSPALPAYTPGAVVRLTAYPDSGYVFAGWSGDLAGETNPIHLTMDSAKHVEALFRPTGGTLYFANRDLTVGLDAPIFDTDGSHLSGSNFVAQLYAGMDQNALTAAGVPIPFRSDDGAGYFPGQVRVLSMAAPGSPVYLQVRVWELSAGATYEEAVAAFGKNGASSILQVTTGNAGVPPTLPASMIGLESFQLRVGPTPPEIVHLSAPLQLVAGESATLIVEATGSRPLHYQWFGGSPGDVTRPLSGNGSRLETGPLLVNSEFWVRVTNAGGLDEAGVQIEVRRQTQSIAFAPLTPVTYGTPPVELSGTASSGLPVQFDVISGPATIAGNLLTLMGMGEVVIRAGQEGNEIFEAAPEIERSLAVGKATATLQFQNLVQAFDGAPKQPDILVNPAGLSFRLTFAGNETPPTAPGEYPVEATITDPNYQGSITGLFSITSIPQWVGQVFLDANGNGLRDNDEAGMPELTVQVLELDGSTVVSTNTTDAEGTFAVRGLSLRSYYLGLTSTPEYIHTTPSLVLGALTEGRTNETFFGLQRAGTISGIVFNDADGTGQQTPEEQGLAGVTLRLKSTSAEVWTTTSREDGSFLFTQVAPGGYWLEEIDLPGYGSTTPNLRSLSVENGGAGVANFGDQASGSVAGLVFLDINGNGIREANESGLAEVSISISGAGVERVAITSVEGRYSFTDLGPGNYTIEETDPSGFISTTPNVRAITLASGSVASASFGDQPVESISGVVFEDRNGNARYDDGEPTLAGVLVRLYRPNEESPVRETTTTESGIFVFSDVPAGEYSVRQEVPDAYTVISSTFERSSRSRASAPEQSSYAEKSVELEGGGSAAVSFANHVTGQLSGLVFNDLDGDGEPSFDEPGLAAVTVEVRNVDTGAVIASALSATDGVFAIPGLTPGTLEVVQKAISGYATDSARKIVTLREGAAATANFANRATGTVAGRVFNDENRDGVRDLAEPGMAGVTVKLHSPAGTREAQTTGDGVFLFADVTPGTLSIEQTVPEGFRSTTPDIVTLDLALADAVSVAFGNQSEALMPPGVLQEPADLELVAGTNGILSVIAEGGSPLRYQWYRNEVSIEGATHSALSWESVSADDAGNYRVEISNAWGSTWSRVASLSVSNPDPFGSWISTHGLSASMQHPGADPDGDSIPNLMEFMLGLSPAKADESDPTVTVVATVGASSVLGWEFHRPAAASSIRPRLEASDDLVHWTPAPFDLTVLSTSVEGDWIRILDREPFSARGHRFIRLGAENPGSSSRPAKLTIAPGSPVASGFGLTLEGEPGRTYLIEWSHDFKSWHLLDQIQAGSTPVTITDASAAGVGHRFYRALPK